MCLQLSENADPEEIKAAGFDSYFVDHGTGVYPCSASGVPFNAVEAKLVHPLLIIVVAVSSLGSYAVPDYSLGLAVRIGQLLLLAAGSIFGVYGIVLFMTALCVRLCSLTSLGAPFAAPLSPPRAHNPDLLTRHPLWQQRWRTWLGSAENNMRSRGKMRGWDRRGQ